MGIETEKWGENSLRFLYFCLCVIFFSTFIRSSIINNVFLFCRYSLLDITHTLRKLTRGQRFYIVQIGLYEFVECFAYFIHRIWPFFLKKLNTNRLYASFELCFILSLQQPEVNVFDSTKYWTVNHEFYWEMKIFPEAFLSSILIITMNPVQIYVKIVVCTPWLSIDLDELPFLWDEA